MTENISAGGVSAVADNTQADWLGIGKLVGLSVEGGSGGCSVGMVRRCNRLPKQPASAGTCDWSAVLTVKVLAANATSPIGPACSDRISCGKACLQQDQRPRG